MGVGTAAKGVMDAKAAASAAKKAAKNQAQALKDANAADPTKKTGADVQVAGKDGADARRRGKGSLAARKKAAALGGLETNGASAIGGL